MSMPFIDLKAQQAKIRKPLDEAIQRVLDHGAYIMGPEVTELEKQLASFCDAKHAITCSSGTDALALILMAWGIKPGDAVFVPAFTFVATAEVVAWLGAVPYFVDVLENSFNIDPISLETAIAEAKQSGLNPSAVIPVDLFGQPANYPELQTTADAYNLKVLSDAAQSFGAEREGKKVGCWGDATATSFFPAKPLGCYGDGGAIFTDNDDLTEKIKSLRIHGQGSDKYDNVRIGINGRLDTIQAAVLIEKLKIFEDELSARQKVADIYNSNLANVVDIPALDQHTTSSWAQYTIKVSDRQSVQSACQDAGIPTAIYYPTPLNQQQGYKKFPSIKSGVPVSEKLAREVISLPMHPYLKEEDQTKICDAVKKALLKKAA